MIAVESTAGLFDKFGWGGNHKSHYLSALRNRVTWIHSGESKTTPFIILLFIMATVGNKLGRMTQTM